MPRSLNSSLRCEHNTRINCLEPCVIVIIQGVMQVIHCCSISMNVITVQKSISDSSVVLRALLRLPQIPRTKKGFQFLFWKLFLTQTPIDHFYRTCMELNFGRAYKVLPHKLD